MTSSVTGGCPLALVILLLVSMEPTATEVVTLVSQCDEFFLDQTPPEIPGVLVGGNIQDQNRYKPICQTFDANRRFMTLYDTAKKIPVFSAYRYTGHTHFDPPVQSPWIPETELDAQDQATIKDWPTGISFDKGHLYPRFHANSKDDQKSTFMLTNCVPQVPSFNRGRWCRMEKYVKDLMDKYCSNQNDRIEAFVIAGAFPSNKYMGSRVNIPTTLWAAFCCYSKELGKWVASAHWGANEEVPKDDREKMKPITLAKLKTDHNFEPFPNQNCLASGMPDDPIP